MNRKAALLLLAPLVVLALPEATRADQQPGAAQARYRASSASRPDDGSALTKRGVELMRQDRVDDAIHVLRRAAQSRGAPPLVHAYLADAYVRRGDVDEARSCYRRAIEAVPRDDPGALFHLAETAFTLGDATGAEAAFAAAFSLPRADRGWAIRAANAFIRHGAAQRGAAFFTGAAVPETVPDKSAAHARLLVAVATAQYRAGRMEDAARSFQRAIELDGTNRGALRDLGWTYSRLGRLQQAQQTWRRYAREYPQLADPHDVLAQFHLERREYGEALQHCRASLALEPRQKGAMARTVRALSGLTRMAEARALAAELAARFPNDPLAQRVLAEALTKSGAFRDAARQWRRVLDLEPTSWIVKRNWVRTLYDAGDADGAVEAARRFAGSPDAPPAVLELLADDAVARQDYAQAAAWYRELTRRVPSRPLYWRNLLSMLGREGRFEEQVAVALDATRRMPSRSDLQGDLATALGDAGHYREAIARSRRLVRDLPESAAAYRGLVSWLSAAGRASEALSAVTRDPASFYKDRERRMLEASLRVEMNDVRTAKGILRSLAERAADEHFVPILLYHGVVDHPRTLQVSTTLFEDQMAALASHGYQAITLDELARMIDGELPFPPRPILITFDDARSDSFALGDPILARHGLKATMFVPTARIGAEDAFHAGWSTLERYVSTGRWELQAHGHEAHTPIPIDAGGDTGEFLVYRKWLAGQRRAETFPEYLERVTADYQVCKDELERRFPRQPVLGFAYPLNEVGREQPGAGAQVFPTLNEALASRLFRFGLVQDDDGYNALRSGRKAPFLLRRFEVPGDWRGGDLLAHLARWEPTRAARLDLARVALVEGRPEAARRMIEAIAREEPLVAPASEAMLAQVAWSEERPREAARHLASSRSRLPAPEGIAELETRLAWKNELRGGVDSSFFGDSGGRSVFAAGAGVRYPFARQVDLEVEAGELRMAGRDVGALAGMQAKGTLTAGVGRRADVSGWSRYRQLSQAGSTLNGGLELGLRAEQHRFGLSWAYEDVDTVRAELKGIRRHLAGASYGLESPGWSVEGVAASSAFEDGNLQGDVRGSLLRIFGPERSWGVGASLELEDTRRDADDYYAPRKLAVSMARARYERTWRTVSSLSVNLGLGAARAALEGLRASGLGEVRLTRWWGPGLIFGTSLAVEARALPNFRSVEGTFGFEMRFSRARRDAADRAAPSGARAVELVEIGPERGVLLAEPPQHDGARAAAPGRP